MKVTELIELTNKMTLDHEDIRSEQREIDMYLSYLNLANLELYKVAATGLDTITKTAKVFLDETTWSIDFPEDLYVIRTVLADRDEIRNQSFQQKYNPHEGSYYIQGKKLFINKAAQSAHYGSMADSMNGNAIKRYVEITYSPDPLKLVETVTDPLLETDEPIYPKPFHHYLAHGALYYFCLSNKVYLEKENAIERRWKEDQQSLAQYKNYGL